MNEDENEPVSRVGVDVDVDVRGPTTRSKCTYPNPRAYIWFNRNDQVPPISQSPTRGALPAPEENGKGTHS